MVFIHTPVASGNKEKYRLSGNRADLLYPTKMAPDFSGAIFEST